MADDEWGPPPVPYCWLAMGSEGRREQTLCTDQDNALLYQDVDPSTELAVRQWFLTFTKKVVDALARFGIPRCKGGVMASNPQWCLGQRAWRQMFAEWIDNPTPERMRLATVFFDFRSISDGFDGARQLRRQLTDMAAGKRHYAHEMTINALTNRPPIGFLRQFVVETSGAHSRGLNLKLHGLTPVVDAVRIIALETAIPETNTMTRLHRIHQQNILDADFAAAIDDAYDYINFIRISHHLRARAHGLPLNNFVDPALLNALERKVLKESFTIVRQLQEFLSRRYQLLGVW
jgi:CBS domain-containing protein